MADNVNLSPDMINNLVNMLKNSNNESNVNNNNSSVDLNNILKNFSSNTSDSSENSSSANSFNNLDFDTIMKIKSIIGALNDKNDPDSNLLYSLKPYLRKTRQAKLDQYINILKISQVSKLLKNEKGDAK